MLFERQMVLGLTRFLPPWLSSFTLGWLFWTLLWRPERFGWELAADFETMLFVEIGIEVAALFVLPGRAEPLAVPSGVLICAVLAIGLGAYTSPIVAFLLAMHFMARMFVSWREPGSSQGLIMSFALAFAALALAWAAAGLFWAHEGAWSAGVVPPSLWWEVPSPQGTRRIPHGLPLFGAVYFSLLTGVEAVAALVRWFNSEVQLAESEVESA